MKLRFACVVVGFLSLVVSLAAQSSRPAVGQVPPLIQFSNFATDVNGKPLTSLVGITFSLYQEQQGGSPLWLETQNVQPDSTGHYTVLLGSTTSQGLPTSIFTSGEAHWLGVQISGQEEQSRVPLVSAPYALKAADAQTVGGLPPSAFVLVAPSGTSTVSSPSSSTSNSQPQPVGGTGTENYIPIWTDNSGDLGDSILYQAGTGSSAKIGINEKNPLFTLDVNGTELMRGLFEMATMNYATPTKAYNSQPLNLESSAYNSGTATYTLNHFQWQAEPVGNNTTAPAATLNLLYGTDPAAPAETGLKLNNAGVFTFATGQTFPGTGTVTSVGSGLGLTGGPITGSGTLTIDTTVVPQLNTANTFTGNQTVNGNVTATNVTATQTVTGGQLSSSGVVNATTAFDLGGSAFAFGSATNANAFLGFAGNSTMTGKANTAIGAFSLGANTSGMGNAAVGVDALSENTTGNYNTAIGITALNSNTTGSFNTALGDGTLTFNTNGSNNTAAGTLALQLNSTGSDSTATGYQALYSNTTGSNNTASGYNALEANTSGGANTAIGGGALQANTVGADNVASGNAALAANTSGVDNTASGVAALSSNTTGNDNVASGIYALLSNNGNYNTGIGTNALRNNTTGTENTALGMDALQTNTTGNDLTCVGYQCAATDPNLHNATAIGAHATVGVSDALVLGGTGVYAVKVGIGTETPSNILTIAQGAGHPLSDGWTTYSSRRWKTNIQTLHGALAKIEQLRGVSYDLKDSGKHEVGVIAEEVGAVVPEVVSYEENGKDARGVDYSRLTALLIEATKEQQREIQQQQAVLRAQAAAIRDLKSELRTTRQLLQKVKAQVAAAQPRLVAAK
jgi:hypothetical protein